MSALDELAPIYQSRRVARDVLAGRKVDSEHWWWWDAGLDLKVRARARQAEDAARQWEAAERLAFGLALRK